MNLETARDELALALTLDSSDEIRINRQALRVILEAEERASLVLADLPKLFLGAKFTAAGWAIMPSFVEACGPEVGEQITKAMREHFEEERSQAAYMVEALQDAVERAEAALAQVKP